MPALELLHRRGVRDPDEARRVERFARRDRHARPSSSACASSDVVRMPSGDRKSLNVREQIERARRLDACGCAARPPATRRPGRAGARYSFSISVTQSCGPVSAGLHGALRDRADVRGRMALQRVARGDHLLRARSSSRSASRSSRRPSTPSRRAPRDRAGATASTADQVVRHRVVDQLLVAEVDQRSRCRAAPPRRRSPPGRLRRSARRSDCPAS